MLFRRALVIVIVKSRNGGGARFEFINVREEESTMVAWLPQQVLLLLILVAGSSTRTSFANEETKWIFSEFRRSSRSSRAISTVLSRGNSVDPRNKGSTKMEHFESSTENDLTDSFSLDTRLDLGFPMVTASNEDRVPWHQMESDGNKGDRDLLVTDVKVHGISRLSSTPSNSLSAKEIKNFSLNPSTLQISLQSSKTNSINASLIPDSKHVSSILPPKVSFENWMSRHLPTTSVHSTEIGFSRRRMRETDKNQECAKFVDDGEKQEFFSPGYPGKYPGKIKCVRVIQAPPGMLIKLDFRDYFEIERSDGCKHDYLEVRDGQHGYSNPLGKFCGNKFPEEITSKTRYLWLSFVSDESIEYRGFRAIWTTVPRPTDGVPREPEPCTRNVTEMLEYEITSQDVEDRKSAAQKDGLPLDCIWEIVVKKGMRIQLSFPSFDLNKPNECDANYVDVFEDHPDIPSRLRNFCGSIADLVTTKNNVAYVHFYTEPKAINSSFKAIMTAIRDKSSGTCNDNEFDCEDACIDLNLKCNKNFNCRFGYDEEVELCKPGAESLIESEHIIIILVVFSLIVFGLCFTFVFNCIRKLVRDHRIIREHIRESRENRLDEIGRQATPCPVSATRTEIGDIESESPSIDGVTTKELLTPSTIIAHEYTKELVMEMHYDAKNRNDINEINDYNDIHQSNNVSNATQERLQESSEEPETRDNACQTRESLFEYRTPDTYIKPSFTTFGFRPPTSQNGSTHQHNYHQSSPIKSISSKQSSLRSQSHKCCSPSSQGREETITTSCPRHSVVPAPPGWSHYDPPYPPVVTDPLDFTYQRYPSPKSSRDPSQSQSPKRHHIAGSGERYGSILGSTHGSITNSGHGSSNTNSSNNSGTPKKIGESRYKAEAVIEVDQKRPFSIESTKSAPDVIATH
ncbi:uncharacterized protein LOC127286283 [Leptopilina boulardi]|uniref:uncharacterized protein LOC127286283 n=1 Tax=Leptopilina boulardi TaxID=63433 RepID=UPI0021F636FD|nr:uncharacterized protein LOC127286283 [Leptopilina boulardi]